jgi:hypothetical protein
MNQTCDRCGPAVRAAYRVDREGELYFCRHCTTRCGRLCPRKAGPSGLSASIRSSRKPPVDRACPATRRLPHEISPDMTSRWLSPTALPRITWSVILS